MEAILIMEKHDECLKQEERFTMPLLNDPAPEFVASTTKGEIHFPQDYKGKWVILFSHPADFTPVCTTEFMTFASMAEDFKAINTELIGLSIDSLFSHIAWIRRIEEIEFKGMKNIKIDFPVIDDIRMVVAKKYGMVQPNQSNQQAVRAVFVIDPLGKIRTIIYYPMSLGRNFDELKRVVQALQVADKLGAAMPANWRPGDDVIVPPANTAAMARDRVENPNGMVCHDWFFCTKPGK